MDASGSTCGSMLSTLLYLCMLVSSYTNSQLFAIVACLSLHAWHPLHLRPPRSPTTTGAALPPERGHRTDRSRHAALERSGAHIPRTSFISVRWQETMVNRFLQTNHLFPPKTANNPRVEYHTPDSFTVCVAIAVLLNPDSCVPSNDFVLMHACLTRCTLETLAAVPPQDDCRRRVRLLAPDRLCAVPQDVRFGSAAFGFSEGGDWHTGFFVRVVFCLGHHKSVRTAGKFASNEVDLPLSLRDWHALKCDRFASSSPPALSQ